MKDNLIFPASIFIIGVAALFFIVVSGSAAVPDCPGTGVCSWLIKDDYSQVYRGLVVNTFRATTGLSVYGPSDLIIPEFIITDGKVGIGTVSPSTALDVAYTLANTNFGTRISNTASTGYGLLVNAASGGQEALRIRDYAGTTELFSVDGNGRVGIGTITPTSRLTIAGGAGSSLEFSGASGTYDIQATHGGGLYIYNTANNFIKFGTNNTERMVINSNGSVDIANDVAIAGNLTVGSQNVCRADGTNCPSVSLSYVGSCNVITATPCKCNAGETIMLLQSYGFTSAGSSFCRVVNQNSISVYGERENSNARVCDFACFK